MKIKNQSSFPSKYRLFILIAVCVILLGIGSVVDSSGPLRFVANYTVIPFQKGISYAGQWMSDASANFQTREEMRSENESLQSKVDELTIDNTRLRQEQYELERLRELYKLDENYSDYEKVGARVISNNGTNWFSDFTIDKGSNDGIKVNCNVLAGSGLDALCHIADTPQEMIQACETLMKQPIDQVSIDQRRNLLYPTFSNKEEGKRLYQMIYED